MHFRHETNLQDAPREIVVVVAICPHYVGVWGRFAASAILAENKIAPSPIIVGLEATLDLNTLRHFCCTHIFLL